MSGFPLLRKHPLKPFQNVSKQVYFLLFSHGACRRSFQGTHSWKKLVVRIKFGNNFLILLDSMFHVHHNQLVLPQICPECGSVGQDDTVLSTALRAMNHELISAALALSHKLPAKTQSLVVQVHCFNIVSSSIRLVTLLFQSLCQHVVFPVT